MRKEREGKKREERENRELSLGEMISERATFLSKRMKRPWKPESERRNVAPLIAQWQWGVNCLKCQKIGANVSRKLT